MSVNHRTYTFVQIKLRLRKCVYFSFADSVNSHLIVSLSEKNKSTHLRSICAQLRFNYIVHYFDVCIFNVKIRIHVCTLHALRNKSIDTSVLCWKTDWKHLQRQISSRNVISQIVWIQTNMNLIFSWIPKQRNQHKWSYKN